MCGGRGVGWLRAPRAPASRSARSNGVCSSCRHIRERWHRLRRITESGPFQRVAPHHVGVAPATEARQVRDPPRTRRGKYSRPTGARSSNSRARGSESPSYLGESRRPPTRRSPVQISSRSGFRCTRLVTEARSGVRTNVSPMLFDGEDFAFLHGMSNSVGATESPAACED